MQKRKFDELISHFNRKVSDMSIDQKYKMELLGMISAIGFAHEKELGTNLASLGTDCISRQAAINEIERAKVRVYHSIERAIGRSITEILDEVEKDVRGLPPSESKRGYWKYNAKIGTFKVWTCDQCGWNSEAEFNFCPNCGAKMEGEQDG